MHPNSGMLFEKYGKPLFKSGQRVLEIGPDYIPSTYQKIIGDPTLDWRTLQLDSEATATWLAAMQGPATYLTKYEYSFPLEDNTFDIVLSGNVIEHVRKSWQWIRELARVCKPGGLVITIAPISWGYHEAPIDCWRIYPDGMRALYDEAGLKTQIAVFESLDATYDLSAYYLFKQAIKRLLGRQPFFVPEMLPVIDMLAVGQKP